MNAVFDPRRIGHVNLIVGELERSTRFYGEVCGLALEFSETGLRGNFMGSGTTHHDLGIIERTTEDRYGKDGHLQIPKSAAAQVRLNHIAWEMDTERDLVDAIERADQAGVAVARIVDHQISHSVYLKDPDGNMLEFYADVIRDWRSVLHGEVDHITSVWRPDPATASTESLWEASPTPRCVDGARFHPLRLSHAVLATDDLECMTDFYQRVVGLSLAYGDGSMSLLRASHAKARYELAIVRSASERGLHHFSFEVSSEAELESVGGSTSVAETPVVHRAAGPLKDGVFVSDPDGFRVEFFVPRGGATADLAAVPPDRLAFSV